MKAQWWLRECFSCARQWLFLTKAFLCGYVSPAVFGLSHDLFCCKHTLPAAGVSATYLNGHLCILFFTVPHDDTEFNEFPQTAHSWHSPNCFLIFAGSFCTKLHSLLSLSENKIIIWKSTDPEQRGKSGFIISKGENMSLCGINRWRGSDYVPGQDHPITEWAQQIKARPWERGQRLPGSNS